ncbi:hypothetical protein N7523_010245 [Penicillium sp. IBT 18751x]|nr:hypothetical protein N7523_010245 [Penicillium sp. IBT 18751x]
MEVLWKVDWSTIVELELLPEPKPDEADATHETKYPPRSNYKKWFWDEIQQLFELDRGNPEGHSNLESADAGGFDILHFGIYCPDAHPKEKERFPSSRRIQSYFEPFNPMEEVVSYIKCQRGKMIIAISTGSSISEEIKRTIQPRTNDDLRLVDLGSETALEWPNDEVSLRFLNTKQTSVTCASSTLGPGQTLRDEDSTSSWSARTFRNEEVADDSAFAGSKVTLGSNNNNHRTFIKQRIAEGVR